MGSWWERERRKLGVQRSSEMDCVRRKEMEEAGGQVTQGMWKKRASRRQVKQSMKWVAAKVAMEVTEC